MRRHNAVEPSNVLDRMGQAPLYLLPAVFVAVCAAFLCAAASAQDAFFKTAEGVVWLNTLGVQGALWVALAAANAPVVRMVILSEGLVRFAGAFAAIVVFLAMPYAAESLFPGDVPFAAINVNRTLALSRVLYSFIGIGCFVAAILGATASLFQQDLHLKAWHKDTPSAYVEDFATAKRLAWSLGAMLSFTIYATSWLQKAVQASELSLCPNPSLCPELHWYPKPFVIGYGIILSFILVVCLAPLLVRFHRRALLLLDQLAPLLPADGQPPQLALRKTWSETLGLTTTDALHAAALSLAPVITATLSVVSGR